jgi:hypothetical protein
MLFLLLSFWTAERVEVFALLEERGLSRLFLPWVLDEAEDGFTDLEDGCDNKLLLS